MAKHYNPSIVNRALRILNSKGGDFLTDDVAGPVGIIDINAKVINISRSALNTANIFTAPTDKDFYITNVWLSAAKAVGDSGSAILVQCTIASATQTILAGQGITLTAERIDKEMAYATPIKVDRGSSITIAVTGTWSNYRAGMQGYTEEVTKD